MHSHMFVVTSSKVWNDDCHSFVIMSATDSSIVILHTSVFLLVRVRFVEGSGWLVDRSGIRTVAPSGVTTTLESGNT